MRPVSAEVGEDEGGADPPRAARPAVVGPFVAIAVAPILAAVWRAGSGWLALQDSASIVLRARDVFTARTPLVGMPTTHSLPFGRSTAT